MSRDTRLVIGQSTPQFDKDRMARERLWQDEIVATAGREWMTTAKGRKTWYILEEAFILRGSTLNKK